MNYLVAYCTPVVNTPGDTALSNIEQIVLTNLEYFYLRVSSCRGLLHTGGRSLLLRGRSLLLRGDLAEQLECGSIASRLLTCRLASAVHRHAAKP